MEVIKGDQNTEQITQSTNEQVTKSFANNT
jgi:hypothetical protein